MHRLIELEKSISDRLETHTMKRRDNFRELKAQFDMKVEAQKEFDALKAEKKALHSTLHLEELDNRKRVLRRLGYLRSDDSLELKVLSGFF